MKKLINPPVQGLLILAGIVLLGLAGWNLVNLKLLDAAQNESANGVNVHIPDSGVLDTPDMDSYPKMVDTPLFWASRQRYEEPATVQVSNEKPAAPVDLTLPEGRLIGIIDMGDHLFGIMSKPDGSSIHMKPGDLWGAWKVTGIDPDRVILALGDQKQDIPLVGDFASPKENPKVTQERTNRQQKMLAQQKQSNQATRVAEAKPDLIPPASPDGAGNAGQQTAGLPFPADTDKQPPALSVNEALEARQRLMASRWGKLTGDAEGNVPPMPGQTTGQ